MAWSLHFGSDELEQGPNRIWVSLKLMLMVLAFFFKCVARLTF
jgi:hypothetical protein